MERLTRLIGIALVAAFAIVSIGFYQRTVSAIVVEPTDRDQLAAASAAGLDRSAGATPSGPNAALDRDSMPPRYLSFTDGLRSGRYRVADLPGSGDRDVTAAASTGDYPPETDLVPHHSLADLGLVAPGLYATAFGVSDCSYEIRRVSTDKVEKVIGEDRLSRGRMLVTLNEIEPDVFVSMPQCGQWASWSPLIEPLIVAGNGDYWIGDLARGSWSVPVGCVWEKVVGFRGAVLADVEESAAGPRPLVVDSDTLGVRIRNCEQPLTLP
ncbi:MAG: hypothetical protein WBM50_05195 [Acidimicrobiales bacterium]